jgi:hypothetical protein
MPCRKAADWLMQIPQLEHVQLAMPAGGEQAARNFYSGLLGIPEVPKPPHLAARGGCWFEDGSLKVHLGVEASFRPAKKAHPAFLVRDLTSLVAQLHRADHGVVAFLGRGEAGDDVYDLVFAKGGVIMSTTLDAAGRMTGGILLPVAPPGR